MIWYHNLLITYYSYRQDHYHITKDSLTEKSKAVEYYSYKRLKHKQKLDKLYDKKLRKMLNKD